MATGDGEMNAYGQTWQERWTSRAFWVEIIGHMVIWLVAFSITSRVVYGEWFWNA